MPAATIDALRDDYEAGTPIPRAELLNDPFVREALFMASGNLFARMDAPEATADTRLGLSLARYLYRMALRATPFGLMAGVTTGRTGDSFRLEVCEARHASRLCRIDQGLLSDLRATLLADPEALLPILRDASITANNSLWRAPDGYRYIEARAEGGSFHYALARLDPSAGIDSVLARLRDGPQPFSQLADALATESGADRSDAEQFLLQMVCAQAVIGLPEIEVTGEDPVGRFIADWQTLPGATRFFGPLAEAAAVLARVGTDPDENLRAYRSTMAALENIKPGIDGSHAIQADLHMRGNDPEIPQKIVDEVLEQIWSLRAVLAMKPEREMESFATEFTRRYGDARVPLLEALDADFGIQLGDISNVEAPLLAGLGFSSTRPASLSFGALETMLFQCAQEAWHKGARFIEISEERLRTATPADADLPSTFSVLGTFHAENAAALMEGRYRFDLMAVPGPSAAAMAGRFCSGDEVLTRKVRAFLAENEGDSEGALVCEVAHLPSGRIGNVILRPVLRAHEIAYLGRSGAEAQIPASDLDLTCRDGRVALYSRSLGRRIIPRITNAHSFHFATNVPVYRFLGLLQFESDRGPRPVWGGLADHMAFLPALTYGKIQLSHARWQLDSNALQTIETQAGSEHLLSGLPYTDGLRHIRVQQHDNYLELDLSRSLDRDLLLEECRRNDSLMIEEAPFEPDELARDTSGRGLRHEVAIPVARRSAAAGVILATGVAPCNETVPPGRNWLYVQVFCGPTAMDRIVVDLFGPFGRCAREAGCRTPYFIRYHEGGQHLRLRVSGDPKLLWGAVREALEAGLKPYLASREASRFEYATYQPEWTRYGGPDALKICEEIFSADSLFVSEGLKAILSREDREDERWRLALASIAGILRSFGLGESDEIALLENATAGYQAEFEFGKLQRNALNAKYRQYRAVADAVAGGTFHPDSEIAAALAQRDTVIIPLAAELKTRLSPQVLRSVIFSLIHMGVNRIVPERPRLQELVLLHFLAKSMASLQGRRRFEAKAVTPG